MSADQAISTLATVALAVMMAATGLGVTFAELAAVVRDGRLLLRAAAANYVAVPAAAVGLLLLLEDVSPALRDDREGAFVAAGFLIAAVCPGGPFGPPLTGLARGNVVVAVGLMVVLAASSAVAAPLLLGLLLPAVADRAGPVSAGRMAGALLLTQFLPLCAGLAARHRLPGLAVRLRKPANLLSLALNVLTLGVLFEVHYPTLADIRPVGYAGMLALVLAGAAAGWLLGGPDRGPRTALTLATSVRNVGVGLVLAAASYPGTRAVAAATAFALFQTAVVAAAALAWGRLASRAAGTAFATCK